MLQEHINQNLKNIATWQRLLYMLIFAVIVEFVGVLLWLIVLIQIGCKLLTGQTNANLIGLGRLLSDYLYQILQFVTFSSDRLPFPFSNWHEPPTPL